MSTGLYAYALTRDADEAELLRVNGIADAPLHLVDQDGLSAVVSEVALDEFGEEGLRRNLEDLGWLESVALAHDRVTRHVAEHGPTAPLRLATVFLGEESLRAQLRQWHDQAERALDRISGRSEWSVKAYVDPAAGHPAPPEEETPKGEGAGRAYLERRREATQRRESRAQAWASAAGEVHQALASACVAGRRLAPQDRRLTGHTGEMVLNGTYLVDDGGIEGFRASVEAAKAKHPGLRVEIAGPWPPYSFASLDEPDAT